MNNQIPYGFMPPFNPNQGELRALNERVDTLEKKVRRLEKKVSVLENNASYQIPTPYANNSNYTQQDYPNNYMI